MLIYIVLISQIFSLTPLKEQEYDYHLKNQHLFVVACRESSEQCEKVKNDFEDIWDDFNFKNVQNFPSKLFELNRTVNNKDFYDNLVQQTQDFVLVYIEHKNDTIKKYLNPLIVSTRKIKAWMNSIENEFSDKIIDQKIEQLDQLINGSQQKQISEQKQKQTLTGNQSESITTVAKKDSQTQNQDALQMLQKQINDEENSTTKRKMNVHDLDVDKLDKVEEKEVLTFFDLQMKKLKDQNLILKKRTVKQDQNQQNKKNENSEKNQKIRQQELQQNKNIQQQKKDKIKNLKFNDIDLSILTKEQIELVKNHFAEIDKQTQEMTSFVKDNFAGNKQPQVLSKQANKKQKKFEALSIELKPKAKTKIIENQQNVPKVQTIEVKQSLYSLWVYFATFLVFMILALKLVLFYKKKEFVRVKRYDDLEEQGLQQQNLQNYNNQDKNEQFEQARQIIRNFLENSQDESTKKSIAFLLKYYKGTIIQLKTALTQSLKKIEKNSIKEQQLEQKTNQIQQKIQSQNFKLLNKLAEKDQVIQQLTNEKQMIKQQLDFKEEEIIQKDQNLQQLQNLLSDKENLQNFSEVYKNDIQKLKIEINKLTEENQVYIQENRILQQKFDDQEKLIYQSQNNIQNSQSQIDSLKIQNEVFQKKIAELSAANIQLSTQLNELNKLEYKQEQSITQNYQTPKKEQVQQNQNVNDQNIQKKITVQNIFSNQRDNTKELIYGSSQKKDKNILSFPAHKMIEQNQNEIMQLNNQLDQLLTEKNQIQGKISRIPLNLKKIAEKQHKNNLENQYEQIQQKIVATKNQLKKFKY